MAFTGVASVDVGWFVLWIQLRLPDGCGAKKIMIGKNSPRGVSRVFISPRPELSQIWQYFRLCIIFVGISIFAMTRQIKYFPLNLIIAEV